MDQATHLFATNPLIVAIANIAALVGAAVLLWKTLGAAGRFAANAYRTSVGAALKRIKQAHSEMAIRSASDLTYYVSCLAMFASMAAMSMLAILVGVIVEGTDKASPAALHSVSLWVIRISTFIWLFGLFYFIMAIMSLARMVSHLRRETDRLED